MSYIIESIEMLSMINKKYRLPRFQRKITWKREQNFELAISIFQNYPIGVIIINDENGQLWLLDGRQRFTALKLMRSNPVELYEWAQKYLGIRTVHDIDTIKEIFWDKITDYLLNDKPNADIQNNDLNAIDSTNSTDDISHNEFKSEMRDIGILDDSSNIDETLVSNDTDSEEQPNVGKGDRFSYNEEKYKDLSILLSLILMIHKKTNKGSRWERIFNFTDYFAMLPYAPEKNGRKIIPEDLREFINKFVKYIDENDEDLTQENFYEYCVKFCAFKPSTDKKDYTKLFKNYLIINWDEIKKSIETIGDSEKLFSKSKIAVIRLNDASALEAQNIFSRINTQGTKLDSAELLSAKPFWNEPTSELGIQTKEHIKKLYQLVQIPNTEAPVRWDLAATLIDSINDNRLLFRHDNVNPSSEKINMNEVSLGFKLLSALNNEGISKADIEKLEIDNEWEQKVDSDIEAINSILSLLLKDKLFYSLQQWKRPLIDLIGDTPVLEFISLLKKIWEDMGKPITYSYEAARSFQQHARILFDRLIYEYSSLLWRGSSDSKFINDLKNYSQRITPVSEDEWQTLLNNAIAGKYPYSSLTPLLYYYYIIKGIQPLQEPDIKYEVDHIIPKSMIENNQFTNKMLANSLGDLCLLPKKRNISKGKRVLEDVKEGWLRQPIVRFTEIAEAEFSKYSQLTSLPELCDKRGELFKDAFGKKRENFLTNY